MTFNLLDLLKTKNDEDDCDCQPTWLALALVVLPAILPIIFDKLGDFILRLFENDEEEAQRLADEEEAARKKKKKKEKRERKRLEGSGGEGENNE